MESTRSPIVCVERKRADTIFAQYGPWVGYFDAKI